MSVIPDQADRTRHYEEPDLTGHIDEHGNVDAEGSRLMVEASGRYTLEIGGEEFLRRWDAGEYKCLEGTGKHSELMGLVMARPRAYAKRA